MDTLDIKAEITDPGAYDVVADVVHQGKRIACIVRLNGEYQVVTPLVKATHFQEPTVEWVLAGFQHPETVAALKRLPDNPADATIIRPRTWRTEPSVFSLESRIFVLEAQLMSRSPIPCD